jgi:hypothetical protein
MSPSKLHAELSDAGWTSVSVEQWGTIVRGPSESDLRVAKELGFTSVSEVNIAEKFAKANSAIIDTLKAVADVADATAGLTLAQAGLNPLANHAYPFDMLEEASLAQRWRELDNLKSPARLEGGKVSRPVRASAKGNRGPAARRVAARFGYRSGQCRHV